MTHLQELLFFAKREFDAASSMGVFKPQGVAIRMVSGKIFTGHSQLHTNAARDALRLPIDCFPSDRKVQARILDQFTICAVAVVMAEKIMRIPFRVAGSNPPVYELAAPKKITKISDGMLATLEEYPAIAKGSYIYLASSKKDQTQIPVVNNMILLDNKL